MVIVFQPRPHVVVCSDCGIYHATNKSGEWKIEQMPASFISKWLKL